VLTAILVLHPWLRLTVLAVQSTFSAPNGFAPSFFVPRIWPQRAVCREMMPFGSSDAKRPRKLPLWAGPASITAPSLLPT